MPGSLGAGSPEFSNATVAFRTTYISLVVLVLLALTASIAWQSSWQPRPVDLSSYPWLYLREGQPFSVGQQSVELIAVGDIFLGRGVAGQADPLGLVSPWLQTSDLVMGNLEGVIASLETIAPSPATSQPGEALKLFMPVGAATTLGKAGFDLLGLANNHAFDLGREGLEGTVTRLETTGIRVIGAGLKADPDNPATVVRLKGIDLAFLAFNMAPQPGGLGMPVWGVAQMAGAIRSAHQQADVVVVSVHWGYEYQARVDPAQRETAQALVEAGADLVVGHHPHVLQGTQVFSRPEARGEQFVAYSLGNFVFDQYSGETQQGLTLRVLVDQRGLQAIQALPVWAGPRPRLMLPEEASCLMARIQPPPQRLGFGCDRVSCFPVTVPQDGRYSGAFISGEIDLTGDGLQERVIRRAGQVTVHQDGMQVWQSPPEWQVLDLALGDPNDDGRAELLLALRKPDAEGVLRSHPFIVAYRGGTYRLLWGGSAVSHPLLEVELGDVDGDGIQDLVVLEEGDTEPRLAVWRWHGWGFSLFWRGPCGPYHDLFFMPPIAGSQAVFSVAEDW